MITSKFYEEMGLVVDQPKQGGGNSNDGNTAKKFFSNPEKASSITGLDCNLIKRFSHILCTLSSCHYIKVEQFEGYCLETAKLLVAIYGWYKMSATVHKILIHGGAIITSLPLPPAQLSEDVLESSHKAYKNSRIYHARKTSRINTNRDILNWMLISSDPVISANRKATKTKSSTFPPEIIEMLDIPTWVFQNEFENAED